MPHLGISRVAHLPYIERSERERERGEDRERVKATKRKRDGEMREQRKR